MEEKIRFQMRISPETDQKVKAAIPLANCQSQNEFVEQALLHYCGCLQAAEAASILAPELAAALRMTVRDLSLIHIFIVRPRNIGEREIFPYLGRLERLIREQRFSVRDV